MPQKYTMRSKEEKLAVVKRDLSGEAARVLEREIGCSDKQIRDRVKIYRSEGEVGLEPKKKPGNPLSRYERRKELTYEEQLQYQIELLKRELVKKEAEDFAKKTERTKRGRCPRSTRLTQSRSAAAASPSACESIYERQGAEAPCFL